MTETLTEALLKRIPVRHLIELRDEKLIEYRKLIGTEAIEAAGQLIDILTDELVRRSGE